MINMNKIGDEYMDISHHIILHWLRMLLLVGLDKAASLVNCYLDVRSCASTYSK